MRDSALWSGVACGEDTFQNSEANRAGAPCAPKTRGGLVSAWRWARLGGGAPAPRRVDTVARSVARAEESVPRRSKTPGVRIVARRRADGVTYYGRWRDEATGKWQDENLTAKGLTTDALRRRWHQRKAEELQAARRAMALGETHTTYEDAAKRYMDDCRRRLRKRSVAAYEYGVRVLVDHLKGLHPATQQTTPADLWTFRTAIVNDFEEPGTVNNMFKRARAALEWWRRAQLVPLLTSDSIADAFKGLPEEEEEIRPLLSHEIRALLEAVTRDEEPRVAALVALILLTGMRRGEAEGIQWEDVELDGPHPCIRLGTWVKTRKARTVDLSICPVAVEILRALPRGGYVISGDEPLTERQGRRWRDRLQVLSRPWTYRLLRQTAASYMANAPAIFGAASAYRTARQLGHSVAVSERSYLGVLPGISPAATVVEAAMQAEDAFRAVVDRLRSTRTANEVDRGSTCDTAMDSPRDVGGRS
jgi:integrase